MVEFVSIFQIEQLCFGFFYSSDVSCNTYLYAKIEDATQYRKITAYVRASSLFGRFISGIFSQSMVSFDLLKKRDLNYCSAGGKRATVSQIHFSRSISGR